jgi:hypothetical protein
MNKINLNKVVVLSVMLFMVSLQVFSQEATEEGPWKRSRVTLAIGHMMMGQGLDDNGKKTWLTVPVWMIDYDYSLSRKWGIGLHNDIITESFKVDGFSFGEEEATIERQRPIASLAVVSFKPGKHATYILGNGGEFSPSGNYFVTQMGLEYAIELPGDWELSPAITYDLKWYAYDSFSISLGIGKKF